MSSVDPVERLSKVRDALADLDAFVLAQKWGDAEEQARFVKALLTQAEFACKDRRPVKSIEGTQKFHRGFKGFESE